MKALALMLSLIVVFVLLSFTPLYAMREGVKIEPDGKPIDIEIGFLVPCVTDWNNDGKKDLIFGQFDKGKIRLYLNYGADNDPKFKDFTYLSAGGEEISLPYG